jgi:transcriptional antiterminator RfaH
MAVKSVLRQWNLLSQISRRWEARVAIQLRTSSGHPAHKEIRHFPVIHLQRGRLEPREYLHGYFTGHIPMRWYVLYTRPNHERVVCERLLSMRFQAYLPLATMWKQSKAGARQLRKPLFPRFVFVRCFLDRHIYLELISTPGVMRLQEDEKGQFIVVPEAEITVQRQLHASGSCLRRTAYQAEGKHVQVTQGQLRGICGILQEGAEATLIIPIHTLQAGVAVELGGVQVTPCAGMAGHSLLAPRFP